MINVKELRIGNWVQWEYYPMEVTEITETGFLANHEIHPNQEELEDAEGIPLDEEILEKCGLTKGWNDLGGEQALEVDLEINILYLQPIDGCSGGHMFRVPCEYLHQLQNLYFALTGKELPFRP